MGMSQIHGGYCLGFVGDVSDSWCGKSHINGVECLGFMGDYGQELMVCIKIRKYVLGSWKGGGGSWVYTHGSETHPT
ncbi:hypothetical protein QJS04_geneDACA002907 [Acorus gramineus]|uniref:Uncharacterized protein n=1 Tax=Acorus gramineus TaxID=55184 RepID=A0AAV9BWE7_ACOGR|nr:hypothetical protein QJS04_geneDACA002907 [Acorus gramineus]